MGKRVIYETSGRAREYSELACNLFIGCEFSCKYCYSPDVLHKTREEFSHPQVRVSEQDIRDSAKLWASKGETRRVLIAFTHDPYMPVENETQITRKCIQILHEFGLNATILTKGGLKSTRDFDLLTSKDAYATTLTCLQDSESLFWEAKAALPRDRMNALALAHDKGIETWVSFEPVLYPEQVKEMVSITKGYVGHFKIGKLNYINKLPAEYQKVVKDINWCKFGWEMKDLMDRLGIHYYFKKDLLREMAVSHENFKQTWK